jgi:hypothetical protein
MASTSSAIADLKAQWPNLHDLDRAKAVRDLKQSGVSTRGLAPQLPAGESGLRRLLKALEAPVEDQLLAYDGKITTNELIRRATASKARYAAKQGEALNLKRMEASLKASKIICKWLRSEGVTSNRGQQIVDEARWLLIKADQSQKFPLGAVPPRMPVAEIILRSKPVQPKAKDEIQTAWRAYWLAVWVCRAWPDDWVHQKAIDLALEEQRRRAGGNRL